MMLAFDGPKTLLIATRVEDVTAVLRAADRAVAGGAFVAGFVTYEAGIAFVPRQATPAAAALPLVALGVYASPYKVDITRPGNDAFALGPLVPEVSKTTYDANVAEILERIRAGDVYQVNLATPFSFAFAGDAYALFCELAHARAFPYSAYVEYDALSIVSCSPELFVRFDGTRLLTKPMKGTSNADDPSALASAKNGAEHVMIVDLLRNDLHRLSPDVRVDRLADVERYPSFSTMTSTIEARRERPFEIAETFEAMFPCGSITGAPKVTAMRAIAELEASRGMFCGSIGYCAPGGMGTWNVAIRTATIDRERGRGSVHVGGGIVADSAPRDEWAEILVKRRFIDRVAPAFRLIETLRRGPDGRYHDLEDHLARLSSSADALHFAFDAARVVAALDAVAERGVLVRLSLDVDGSIATSQRPIADDVNPVIVLSSQTVDPREPLQRHKTDWRPHYDRALAEARALNAFDAVLRTPEPEGRIADGARSNVFVDAGDAGPLRTPPLTDGALPGVLRAQLLDAHVAVERSITLADLRAATRLYAGNSARGLLRVRFEATTGTPYAAQPQAHPPSSVKTPPAPRDEGPFRY